MKPNVQLLAYRFDAGAAFEGQLIGALERIESGGTLRIREVLFVGRDPESGELIAVAAHGRQQGSLVAPLLGFRLDAHERTRATERALRTYDRDPEPNPLRRARGDAARPAPPSPRCSSSTSGRMPSTTPSRAPAAPSC